MKKLNKMKITVYFLFFSVVLVSCSDDDNTPTIPVYNIVGSWEMIDLNYTGNSTTTDQGQSTSTTYVGVGTNFDASISFTENPNILLGDGTYDIELTSTTSGVSETNTITGSTLLPSCTWSRNGASLIFVTEGQEDSSATILELSATNLKLQSDSDETFEYLGVTVVNSISVITTLIRTN